MIALLLTLAQAQCPNPMLVAPGDYEFGGDLVPIKSVHFENFQEDSHENQARVRALEGEGYSCRNTPTYWRKCRLQVQSPALPDDVERTFRVQFQDPELSISFQPSASEPELLRDSPSQCVWQVRQDETPSQERSVRGYEIKLIRASNSWILRPLWSNDVWGQGFRLESPSNLRLVRSNVPLDRDQGVSYLVEGEFTQ